MSDMFSNMCYVHSLQPLRLTFVVRCDLSISAGSQQSASGNTISQLNTLKQRILVDETCIAWQSIGQSNQIIDIVMDNAGYELFTDLCLADFLISFNSAIKVRLFFLFFIFNIFKERK